MNMQSLAAIILNTCADAKEPIILCISLRRKSLTNICTQLYSARSVKIKS